jgi:hypothetical protein
MTFKVQHHHSRCRSWRSGASPAKVVDSRRCYLHLNLTSGREQFWEKFDTHFFKRFYLYFRCYIRKRQQNITSGYFSENAKTYYITNATPIFVHRR